MTFKRFNKLYLNPTTQFDNSAELVRVINQLQSNIENSINPLVQNTHNDSIIIPRVRLLTGQNNIINHLLNRPLVKWCLIRVRGQCQVWDDQDNNTSPQLTLWLLTDQDVTVDIEVA